MHLVNKTVHCFISGSIQSSASKGNSWWKLHLKRTPKLGTGATIPKPTRFIILQNDVDCGWILGKISIDDEKCVTFSH